MSEVLTATLPAWAGIVNDWCEDIFGDPRGPSTADRGRWLLEQLRTDRRLCLFACACARPYLDAIEHRKSYARAPRVIESAERLVDGKLPLPRAPMALDFKAGYPEDDPIDYAVACVASMWWHEEDDEDEEDAIPPVFVPPQARRYRPNERRGLRRGVLAAAVATYCATAIPREATARQLHQGQLIAGMVAPGWQCVGRWRTDTVRATARQMYETRDFSGMPVLADALQEASCECEWLEVMRDTSWSWCRGCRIIDDLC